MEKAYVDTQIILMRYAVQKERYTEAFQLFDALINGAMINTTSYFYNVTGIKDYYNYLHTLEPEDQNYFIPFINQPSRRKQIHVGNVSFGGQNYLVAYNLVNDVVSSSEYEKCFSKRRCNSSPALDSQFNSSQQRPLFISCTDCLQRKSAVTV